MLARGARAASPALGPVVELPGCAKFMGRVFIT